jgi:hypothetical protein
MPRRGHEREGLLTEQLTEFLGFFLGVSRPFEPHDAIGTHAKRDRSFGLDRGMGWLISRAATGDDEFCIRQSAQNSNALDEPRS